ncbi:recombinase family protein [Lacrimispora saccharolytica]|uniref:Resolvase domain protein n=1 Tax=Lacrimispora saccharolytica (strain ATCC 35040 / DSM 2544 / NRCC 2533 / WM1) TaxID=610130 RepID=D9R8H3_LACSW|nr:recombinase family protein [Lacrimispora saccharolytica]ADL05702.1 Resolvase domain protein [[Clostridium] saccharolyticum WM1]QRV20153.1 recombinase family protein [Lacrimispora saccharolytica]
MDKKSAWIYCRIDAPEDIHGALKGQYERLETYATQMGFTVVGSSQDLGSGLSFDRPGLQAVLEAAKNGSFQVLLVDSISRVGRNMAKTISFIQTISGCGINIYSPMEGEIKLSDFAMPPF